MDCFGSHSDIPVQDIGMSTPTDKGNRFGNDITDTDRLEALRRKQGDAIRQFTETEVTAGSPSGMS